MTDRDRRNRETLDEWFDSLGGQLNRINKCVRDIRNARECGDDKTIDDRLGVIERLCGTINDEAYAMRDKINTPPKFEERIDPESELK